MNDASVHDPDAAHGGRPQQPAGHRHGKRGAGALDESPLLAAGLDLLRGRLISPIVAVALGHRRDRPDPATPIAAAAARGPEPWAPADDIPS